MTRYDQAAPEPQGTDSGRHRRIGPVLLAFATGIALAPPGPGGAHEFWIEATPGPLAPEAVLSTHVRVGEDLVGDTLSWLPDTMSSMRHVPPGEDAADIPARLGDLPAIGALPLTEPGLHRLTVTTNPSYVVFDDMAEFADYLAYEGLDDVVDMHRARDLAETEIAEEYLRYARTLVQVGPVAPGQQDAPTGLALELVVDGTPFGEDPIVPVALYWQGEPLPSVQVAVFHRRGGNASTRRLFTTDDDGRIALPVSEEGIYLLNAVRMDPADGPGSVTWRSHWASMTFARP